MADYVQTPHTYIHVRELPYGNVTVQVRPQAALPRPEPREFTPDAAADYLARQPQCGVEILCFDHNGEDLDDSCRGPVRTVEDVLRSKYQLTMMATKPCPECGGRGTVDGQRCPRSTA
jgi:hypothetical protein